jgi:predicted amidohydrolase YtcJ
MTRRAQGADVFVADQRMSRLEALRSYTVNNAFAAFEEDLKGTLSVGKLADITVLSRDITTVPDEAILETRAVYTIIGGKIVYRGN